MKEEKWLKELNRYFEGLRIIEKYQQEAKDHFNQLCEFIVEPAFEALENTLKARAVRIKYDWKKDKFIHLQINFPQSRIDNFHYTILLPSNSLELKLVLKTAGRKNQKAPLVEEEKSFLPEVKPEEVLKLTKEDIIIDIIQKLKKFNYQARTTPD
ncbi:MAG: hypothetical protein PHQ25_06075 [Acidobacteriota bacterium]|nr:hypothetical protein [Acidobacteriota bacterium]MDW3229435.1 hypothetical protein [Acidobacteriota bacterium]MDY0231874.1 hypothetical protein [Candidatus Saccharicenans sp.]